MVTIDLRIRQLLWYWMVRLIVNPAVRLGGEVRTSPHPPIRTSAALAFLSTSRELMMVIKNL
jgi:hypothetical protein